MRLLNGESRRSNARAPRAQRRRLLGQSGDDEAYGAFLCARGAGFREFGHLANGWIFFGIFLWVGFRKTRKRKQSTTRSPDKHYVRALICLSLNGLPPYILPCTLERPLSFSLIINLRMCTVILELHLDVIFFFRLCVIPLHLVRSSQVFLS